MTNVFFLYHGYFFYLIKLKNSRNYPMIILQQFLSYSNRAIQIFAFSLKKQRIIKFTLYKNYTRYKILKFHFLFITLFFIEY